MAAATTKSHFHHHTESSAPRKQSRPRPITEEERAAIEPFLEKVHYSPRYPVSLNTLIIDTLMMILNIGLLAVDVFLWVDMLCCQRIRLKLFQKIILIRKRGL